jgi:predicted hydrocarbon binding protein
MERNMKNQRKYRFDWDNTVGADMKLARPALGPDTKVEVYRLFQFTLRDILEQHYGSDEADNLFREAGVMAGKAFYEKFLNKANDISSLAAEIQASFNKLGIGIFRVENAAEDNSHFIFTVGEDLDCSGLPDTSDVVCVYDEGFIQGILESFSGKNFNVKEIDCWCTGARTCRFEAKRTS